MLKKYTVEANSVEEAVAKAAAELNISADDLQYDVLQEAQKKTLGLFGGSKAKIEVTYNDAKTPAEAAKEYLAAILTDMGMAEPVIRVAEEEDACRLIVEGENLGFIIGRRGETLDALQYLVSLVANRVRENDYLRVTIDVGDYREKRKKALEDLAHRMAKQASKTGRRHSLEAMNPYERRIVHTAVQDIEGATSWSVGSEPYRHVVIGPSDDNPMKNKARSNNRGRGRGNGGNKEGRRENSRPAREGRSDEMPQRPPRQVREFIPRSNPLHTAADDTPLKTESKTESTATLYGRIDI